MKKVLVLIVLLFSANAFAQGVIETVAVSMDKDMYKVHVRGQQILNCQTELLPPTEDVPVSPLAIDCPQTKNKLYPKTFDAKENAFVQRLKTAQVVKEGVKYARLILELKMPVDHTVSHVEDGVIVVLRRFNSKPAAPATSPATAAPKPSTSTSVTTPKKTPPPSLDIVIGSEDLLEINVFDLPQFNVAGARVAADGTITMPLVGSVEVRGLTKQQVEQRIEQALESKYVNNANVSVTIKEYKSRQVSLLGSVKSPGAYYIISSRTLLQLISEAGGLAQDAGHRCFIFRQGAAKIEIDLRDLMINGNPELNIPIYPGDVINIPPESKIVIYVLGAVKSPGAVEMTTSIPVTLLAAIARAGGPSEAANKSKIQIKRKDETGTEVVIKANLKDILSGKAQDVPLLPGDVVNVPESFF